jgi:uncharacterized protein (DUF1697 family)
LTKRDRRASIGARMQPYVAFLRAINVGGHVVKMDQLRSLFTGMGFGSVSTVVASGNVIFEASPKSAHQLEGLIARKLRDALGYDVGSFVRTPAEVAAVVAAEPFSRADLDTPGIALTVIFLASSPSAAAREKLMALRSPLDDFHVAEREAYWLCRTRISESPVFKKGSLEKTLGVPGTARNITTVRKVSAVLQAVGGGR